MFVGQWLSAKAFSLVTPRPPLFVSTVSGSLNGVAQPSWLKRFWLKPFWLKPLWPTDQGRLQILEHLAVCGSASHGLPSVRPC